MTFWDLILVWFAPIAIGIGIAFYYAKRKKDPSAGGEESHPELLSMIAHQLRSPLTSVKWISERLATTKLEADQRDKVLEIQKVNQHLIDLLENLKKIGKEKLNGEAEGREYFLANLVNEITGLFKSPAERKNIRIVLGVHPGIGKIRTDKFLLTEAMKNILENAIDYSPAGSTIDISVRQDGGRYAIAISNDKACPEQFDLAHCKLAEGGGISEKDGGGLGLLIAQTAIRANRGELAMKSPNGQGASFVISLPGSENSTAR
ncbi:MAG: two-component system, OmpR family, sensor kinase [Parcubacteria group bacterium Gr01-1014_3]|nr:MAG: two-component system, OmpR family, sensor kinase [Parcubacteria group bacterium Gr01-1014_3]